MVPAVRVRHECTRATRSRTSLPGRRHPSVPPTPPTGVKPQRTAKRRATARAPGARPRKITAICGWVTAFLPAPHLGWLRNPELPRGPVPLPPASCDHPIETPVRSPPLKVGTTTTTQPQKVSYDAPALWGALPCVPPPHPLRPVPRCPVFDWPAICEVSPRIRRGLAAGRVRLVAVAVWGAAVVLAWWCCFGLVGLLGGLVGSLVCPCALSCRGLPRAGR